MARFDKRFLKSFLDQDAFWKQIEKLQETYSVKQLYSKSLQIIDQLENQMSRQQYEQTQKNLIACLVAIVDYVKIPQIEDRSPFDAPQIPRIFVKATVLNDDLDKSDVKIYKDTVKKLVTGLEK